MNKDNYSDESSDDENLFGTQNNYAISRYPQTLDMRPLGNSNEKYIIENKSLARLSNESHDAKNIVSYNRRINKESKESDILTFGSLSNGSDARSSNIQNEQLTNYRSIYRTPSNFPTPAQDVAKELDNVRRNDLETGLTSSRISIDTKKTPNFTSNTALFHHTTSSFALASAQIIKEVKPKTFTGVVSSSSDKFTKVNKNEIEHVSLPIRKFSGSAADSKKELHVHRLLSPASPTESESSLPKAPTPGDNRQRKYSDYQKENFQPVEVCHDDEDDDVTTASSGYCMPEDILNIISKKQTRTSSSIYSSSAAFNYMNNHATDDSSIEASMAAEASSVASSASRSPSNYVVSYSDDSSLSRFQSVNRLSTLSNRLSQPTKSIVPFSPNAIPNGSKTYTSTDNCSSSASVVSSKLEGESLISDSDKQEITNHVIHYSRPRNQLETEDAEKSHCLSISRSVQSRYRNSRRPQPATWQNLSNPNNLMEALTTIQLGWSKTVELIRPSRRKRQPTLSPRSRNLADLKFLTAQHKHKVEQLSMSSDPEDQFDFVLILQPQEVYAYWADLLDFRLELLGVEVTDAMDDHWTGRTTTDLLNDLRLSNSRTSEETNSSSESSGSPTSTSESSSSIGDEAKDILTTLETPTVGVRRRHAHTNDQISSSNDDGIDVASTTPVTAGRLASTQSPCRTSLLSPGLYSVSTSRSTISAITAAKNKSNQQSLFERAVGTPETRFSRSGSNMSNNNLSSSQKMFSTPSINNPMLLYGSKSMSNQTNIRRRWGNHNAPRTQHQNINDYSPPLQKKTITSILETSSDSVQPQDKEQSGDDENLRLNNNTFINNRAALDSKKHDDSLTLRDPNEIRPEDIPNPTIARGIVPRISRSNGLMPFLKALKRGIVLRRHRPGHKASFCRIFSGDNGDTIQYVPVDYEEAISAFKEQRIRFNTKEERKLGVSTERESTDAQPWSLEQNNATINDQDKDTIPRYTATDVYRKSEHGEKAGIGNCVTELATKVVTSGTVKIADIVAVHPARNKDPRSDAGEFGSLSLRKTKSDFNTNLSFSLVTRAGTRVARGFKDNIDELENKWHERQGNENQFKYMDFEAATEGEYWLIFRGILLLHRDALVGRFAKQRAAGFGSAPGPVDVHKDEFHEPKTVGCLEKLIVKLRDLDTEYMEGYFLEGAHPPPSDYFLGFRSPGTEIWSRLRQAGLETRRIYSLDPRRVMIKVRCPPDRMLDVAEVLRVKLKTKEGTFAPFREDMIDTFDSKFESAEGPFGITPEFQFSSSIRQAIIDFIIGSRIRDSGAELGQATDLGKLIQARVPLHMKEKLDDIFKAWFYFWHSDNWKDRDGRSLSHEKLNIDNTIEHPVIYGTDDNVDNIKKLVHAPRIPGIFTRFFTGCFYQPLDSIEQYFGEKVAFYFTWLQHTASHLVFLSVAGLIVSICQATSNNPNHPIRPYFSIVVMIWTFVVLINWKKRANFMAYRWGTLNYKEQETTRPQFCGKYAMDPVTGEWVVTYPKWKRWLKYAVSFPLTVLFTFGTLILILWVHANRDLQLAQYIENKDFHYSFKISSIGKTDPVVKMRITQENLLDPEFWVLVVALPSMLGLFLPLLNFILMRLSIMLNDFENYRTESEYRTSLIIKVFSFRFVCYFATLYYYAFITLGNKVAIENGILRVSSGVLVYTTVAQYWQNFLHVCFPILVKRIRMRHRRQRLCNELRDIELDEEEIASDILKGINENLKERQAQLINRRLLLEQAQDETWIELMNPQHDSFPEYIQAVVQFTFVSCFSVVLPITPLIVLVNHLISMRLDAFKLCRGRRRPLAEKTGGIGVWEHLLHIVAVISVLTNCWLMGFTSSQAIYLRESKLVGDLGVFAIIAAWEHVMLLIKYIMSTASSTLPKSVRDAMRKDQYMLDQQRNGIMRVRRQQRDQEEYRENEIECNNSLTALNRRALYGRVIMPSSSYEEHGSKI